MNNPLSGPTQKRLHFRIAFELTLSSQAQLPRKHELQLKSTMLRQARSRFDLCQVENEGMG